MEELATWVPVPHTVMAVASARFASSARRGKDGKTWLLSRSKLSFGP